MDVLCVGVCANEGKCRDKRVVCHVNGKLNLIDLIHIAYRWMWLLIVVTLLGGTVGYAYSYFVVKPTYVSTGNMYVSSVAAEYMEEELDNLPLSVINASARLAADYVEIIEYDSILKDVAAACDSDVTEKQVADMMKATVVAVDSPLIQITVRALDPYVAYDVAGAVLKVASERLPIVAEVPGTVTVVEAAKNPVYSKTNPLVHGIAGCFVGLVLGILLVLFIELMDNRIKQTDDIVAKYNLPVIGVVPSIRGSKESKE